MLATAIDLSAKVKRRCGQGLGMARRAPTVPRGTWICESLLIVPAHAPGSNLDSPRACSGGRDVAIQRYEWGRGVVRAGTRNRRKGTSYPKPGPRRTTASAERGKAAANTHPLTRDQPTAGRVPGHALCCPTQPGRDHAAHGEGGAPGTGVAWRGHLWGSARPETSTPTPRQATLDARGSTLSDPHGRGLDALPVYAATAAGPSRG